MCQEIDKFKLIIEKALEQNVDLNALEYNNFNSTFLGYIGIVDKIDIIQFSLEKGANPNIPNKYGKTPLCQIIGQYVFNQNDLNKTKLLIQKGSD